MSDHTPAERTSSGLVVVGRCAACGRGYVRVARDYADPRCVRPGCGGRIVLAPGIDPETAAAIPPEGGP